ncbi:MAG: DMT family transporter [Vibrio sp.]
MKNWLFLSVAILMEVIATSTLKSTNSFTKLLPSIVVFLGYGISFYFLSLSLKSIPVGIAYAIWSGVGVALVCLISWIVYGQKLDTWGLVGIGFIVCGVGILNLLSKTSAH